MGLVIGIVGGVGGVGLNWVAWGWGAVLQGVEARAHHTILAVGGLRSCCEGGGLFRMRRAWFGD